MYPNRRACIWIAVVLCTIGAAAAQENQARTTTPTAGQTSFGLGSEGDAKVSTQ
jgi:hypothetical protein